MHYCIYVDKIFAVIVSLKYPMLLSAKSSQVKVYYSSISQSMPQEIFNRTAMDTKRVKQRIKMHEINRKMHKTNNIWFVTGIV